jgi:hypothetical protein
MFNKILTAILIMLVLAGCPNVTTGEPGEEGKPVNFQITSPLADWTYYRNRVIQLSMNTRSNNIKWYADDEGFLGSGNNLLVHLKIGCKTISAHYNGKVYEVFITVNEDVIAPLEERRYMIAAPEISLLISPGHYFPALISAEGTATLMTYGYGNESMPRSMRPSGGGLPDQAGLRELKRDFHVEIPPGEEFKLNQGSRAMGSRLAMKPMAEFEVGDTRTFTVLDTTNQYNTPHSVEAELAYMGDKYTLWLPVDESIDSAAIDKCRDNLDTVIMMRLTTIWGEWTDVDDDGKIAILFSKTINDEGVALGYFNPLDILQARKEEEDIYLNKMDIVYAALPDSDESSGYNYHAISATMAHEITHAITYSKKTYNKLVSGTIVNREELFLDEGFSHLSENLCGFGVSGGNIAFLKKYFDNPQDYSLCMPNRAGQADSNGMRGAMCLFLSWLFWNKGGLEFDAVDPGKVYDRGGIAFLQALLKNNLTGWNSLAEVLGESMDQVFFDFVFDMNKQRARGTVYDFRKDPFSNNPVEFYNSMGNISYQSTVYAMNIKTPVLGDDKINTLPWSFFLLPAVTYTEEFNAWVKTEFSMGKIFLALVKGP